jgi:hypothetical protein
VDWVIWLGLGLCVLGVACRLLRFGLCFPIWADEARLAFNFVERDYRGLLRELNHEQIAPLLFLWIEKFVCQIAGPSEQCLRLVPLLAGIGGLLLFWRLARLCLSPLGATLGVGILAVSGWPIELAVSIKPYSFDLFLAVLLLFLAAGHLRQPRRTARLAVLALIIPFAVLLSYPVVFVAGAVSIVLFPVVFRQGSRSGRGWFIAFNVLLVAAFLGQLLFVGREKTSTNSSDVEAYMQGFWHHGFPHGGPLKALWWCVRAHVGRMFSYPIEVNGGGLVGLLLIVLGIHSLRRQGQRQLLLLCLLPFALHFLAACLHRYPYGMCPRLEQHLAPAICLLAGAGLAALVERLAITPTLRRRWLIGSTGALAIVGVGMAVTDCCRPYHDEVARWARDVAQHLQQQTGPEVIFVRQPLEKYHFCLRWALLPWADRIEESEGTALIFARAGGRVWVLDERETCGPEGLPEPVLRPPADLQDPFDDSGWQVTSHRRFLTHFVDEKPLVYRFCCDVFACEPVQQIAELKR